LARLSQNSNFMPNTKSAERRSRNSARKNLHNSSVKTKLNTLEKKYLALVAGNKKEDATKAFRDVSSAFDKAAKTGVVHRSAASRKKSRLAVRLNGIK